MGVLEPDIYIMEPSREFSSRIVNPILALYPNVQFWDANGRQGHQVTFNYSPSATTTIDHSNPGLTGDNNYSYLPEQLGLASYLISVPIMKGHGVANVSLTFKNHFGSLKKWTYAKLHDYALPFRTYYSYAMNPLHDIYLNPNIKDKTFLIVGDGLFLQQNCHRRYTSGMEYLR